MTSLRFVLRALGRRLPVLDGTIDDADIDGPIRIARDRFGVPTIDASTDGDAWWGLGFCQGQDRSFQLELRQRIVRGTLAAAIGKPGLATDQLSRRIGFHRFGRECAATLPDRSRRLFDRFAAGVQAGRTRGSSAPAHEYSILGIEPTEFRTEDALGFLALQAFALSSNWDVELARLEILEKDGMAALLSLDPDYRPDHPASALPGEQHGVSVSRLRHDAALLEDWVGLGGGGSNNWAIAGDRTASGRPIVANDPHLGPVLPPQWYLAHIRTPEWSIVGASVPATPTFGAGHNGHVAWGVTAGLIDNTDLYLEELSADGHSVKRADEWVPCVVLAETIDVKDSEPVIEEVVVTDRGPIVGPGLQGARDAISMAATWLEPSDLGAGFDAGRIETIDDLATMFDGWAGPPLNVAFADETGSIGWQLIGSAPVRRVGWGSIPLHAADPLTRWTSQRITGRSLPGVVDPPAGYVATANNLPATDGPWLGADFLDGYRVQRITELVSGRSDWDVAGTLEAQVDRYSIPWREMREPMLTALREASDLTDVVARLDDWDGVLATDSVAATVFEIIVSALTVAVAAAKAPRSLDAVLGTGYAPYFPYSTLLVRRTSHLVDLLRRQPPGWFAEGWNETIRRAARQALAAASTTLGDDKDQWSWGEVRQLTLTHPLSARRPLGKIFDIGPIAWGGDANTVNPWPVDPRRPLKPGLFAIASLRMVVEIGDWDNARFVLPGGQSGNPLSPHYGDQVEVWRRGDAIPLRWNETRDRSHVRHLLHITPV